MVEFRNIKFGWLKLPTIFATEILEIGRYRITPRNVSRAIQAVELRVLKFVAD